MSYCPYCNANGQFELTDEDVIPQSIGGDSRTVIRVCRPCNSSVGRVVDTSLSRDGWIRLNGLFVGGIATRHDRLETTSTLKDGRILDGYHYLIQTDTGVLPAFEPKKQQPDGTL